MALTHSEKQEFLARPHVAALSVATPDRGTLTVPIWYAYTPGGRPWITTLPTSAKMQAITAAGRFGLMVDTVAPEVKYVSVEGAVADVRPSTAAQIAEMAGRYLSGDALEQYLVFAHEQLGEHVTVWLEPEHWLGALIG
ncbi:pyridoxamine 5-phosphate oxidase [Nocardia sp. MH4]|uniref:pyridoxamine 5'-phosphate oxidase family protein n=1 Tax=Nocardia TaxID=1817 RepID=UPI001C4E79BF|nr:MULTISPECIES: pyridoxamine 5'-phosphate oxidase family protein [Nocardia]MBW0274193.1 pyridoxamine 5-phosphate oxidase [Nocardia sp. MH4]